MINNDIFFEIHYPNMRFHVLFNINDLANLKHMIVNDHAIIYNILTPKLICALKKKLCQAKFIKPTKPSLDMMGLTKVHGYLEIDNDILPITYVVGNDDLINLYNVLYPIKLIDKFSYIYEKYIPIMFNKKHFDYYLVSNEFAYEFSNIKVLRLLILVKGHRLNVFIETNILNHVVSMYLNSDSSKLSNKYKQDISESCFRTIFNSFCPNTVLSKTSFSKMPNQLYCQYNLIIGHEVFYIFVSKKENLLFQDMMQMKKIEYENQCTNTVSQIELKLDIANNKMSIEDYKNIQQGDYLLLHKSNFEIKIINDKIIEAPAYIRFSNYTQELQISNNMLRAL